MRRKRGVEGVRIIQNEHFKETEREVKKKVFTS